MDNQNVKQNVLRIQFQLKKFALTAVISKIASYVVLVMLISVLNAESLMCYYQTEHAPLIAMTFITRTQIEYVSHALTQAVCDAQRTFAMNVNQGLIY